MTTAITISITSNSIIEIKIIKFIVVIYWVKFNLNISIFIINDFKLSKKAK